MRRTLFIMVAALMALSCVSAPEPVKVAPDWTLNEPKPDATYTYFTGWASDPSGDVEKATDDAIANMTAKIVKFIGVKVAVDSTAEAKATLQEYEATITQSVKLSASSRMAGFMVQEKYIAHDGQRVIVYILASYITVDLNKEKARMEAVFQAQIDAVAIPEREGRAFAESGRYYDAVLRFIQAAVAASSSGIDNAEISMERNINAARNILAKMRFVRVNDGLQGSMGQPFAEPFQARLVYGESDSSPAIPGAGIVVGYPRKQASGRVITKTDLVQADATGLIAYLPPAPDSVGKGKITMRMDFASAVELLDKIPAKFDAYKQAILDDIAAKIVEFQFNVISRAREIPMGVFIVELGADGSPAGSSVVQGGLLESLTKERFKVQASPIDAALVQSGDDAGILAAIKAAFGGKIERFAYGTASVLEVRKDGSNYIATAKASIKVLDLATGQVLFSAEKTFMAVGSDEASARQAALKTLGANTIGKEMMANLP